MALFDQFSGKNPAAMSREYAAYGIAHLQKGAYEEAIRAFSEAIQLDATNVEAYNKRGWAHLKKGDWEPAVRDFTEAIRLDPTKVDAYRGRWLAYRSLNDDANAAADERTLQELGAAVHAPTQSLKLFDERQAKAASWCRLLAFTALFALVYWAPMFLVDTPSWCLWTEPVLVLILAFLITWSEGWVTIPALVAVFLLMILAPGWSGWQWLFPVVASIPCLILIGLFFLELEYTRAEKGRG